MTSTLSQKYQPKGSKKIEHLRTIEKKSRENWESEKIYESNAPAEYSDSKEKYLTTFPYPYMNGRLHLGHAFSATKSEFKCRYMRLTGKNSLWPFAFHCTGMPISAAANKLKREIENPDLPKKQWGILSSLGIPDSEIPNFANPLHWLEYFPPKAHADLKEFGVCVDWRRSFITTEKNPYYDSFIRWQFETLKARNKLSFGKRHTVYCTIDKQPCADHDRQSGEGIMPQVYTLIKMQLLEPLPAVLKEYEKDKVFMVAATMRPETMYGQTNCFVLPDGEYGAFRMKSGEIFLCSERCAKNMAYQEMLPEDGKYEALKKFKGVDVIGAALKAPLTKYEKDEWVMGYEPIPIIKTPTYGDMAAVKLCEMMKINSQKDTEKLKEAKDLAYLKGYNEGVMTVGICDGVKVSAVKNQVKDHMIEKGWAVEYYEPYDTVISRSGDECVVALCDQWSLCYGEPEWKKQVLKHVKSANFTCYFDACYKLFLETLDWLKDWACSRTFGLGSHIPWDPTFLIESLSDSTIYNAYYTVSHLLQGGVLDGSVPGPLGIKAQDISHSDWDYVFLGKPYNPESKIEEAKLKAMRHEFEYWYPVDMRCSAKDLIKNHLTMMLYNHAAIWNESPEKMPRSFFCNGYVMVDGRKMSKQEGNFYTLNDVLTLFGSDATRLALATAGDLLEDANVEIKFMDDAILRLFTLQEWIEKQLPLMPAGPLPEDSEADFLDKMFINDMISMVEETHKAYEAMRFRDVIKFGFFEFQGLKDDYLLAKRVGKLNWKAIIQYIEWQLIIISPIIPHITDYCWRYMLLPKLKEIGLDTGKAPSVINAKFPTTVFQQYDESLGRISNYLKNIKRNMRLSLNKAEASKQGKKKESKKSEKKKESKKAKGKKEEDSKETIPKEPAKGEESKEKPAEEKAPKKKPEKKEEEKEENKFTKCLIFVAKEFNEIQNKTLKVLNEIGLNENNEPKKEIIPFLKPLFEKPKLNQAMKFASFCLERAKTIGSEALEIATPFDEKELLGKNIPFLSLDMPVNSIEIFEVKDECPYDKFKDSKMKATPANPEIFYL